MTKDLLTDVLKSQMKPMIHGSSFLLFPKKKKEKKIYAWNSSIPISKATTLAKRTKRLKKRTTRARKGKNFKRAKLPSIKSLKAKADKVFSDFIRNRDSFTCVLCESKTNIQCGHLIKRGKMATRYNEMNCSALCNKCNYRDNYDHDIYVNWFINKHGEKKYAQLFVKSRKIKQLKRINYLEIIDKYGKINH